MNANFYDFILTLITNKYEGEYWDYKQEHHQNKSSFIHDLICMANNRSGKDGYILFGISDAPKGEIIGVENDKNRRTQQQIIDLIQGQKWAFGVYPSVELRTFNIQGHEIDVLIVKGNIDVPYYLIENCAWNDKVVRKNYIYTRVCDTNSPIDKGAAPNQVESIWRRRFGLDLQPLEQIKQKLLNQLDWMSYEDDDTGDEVFYNRFSPEYTIRKRFIERPEIYPFYSYVQWNESTGFLNLYLMYHSTILAKMELVSLDSGRYTTPEPEWGFIHDSDHFSEPLYSYRYILQNSIEYYVQQFLFNQENSEQVHAKSCFDEVVLYFNNSDEFNEFQHCLESNLEIVRTYLSKEIEPIVDTGQSKLDKKYKNQIMISRALKKIQIDDVIQCARWGG